MASVYKRKNSKKFYIQWKDENGKWHTEVGFESKQLSLKKGEELEFAAQQKLRGWGNPFAESRATPFVEHIAAYKRSLHGNSSDYIERTITKIESFGFESIQEINSPTATDTVIKKLATLGTSTANHYLTAIKGFCRWLQENNRIPTTPILGLKKQQEIEADDSDKRRAATDKEIKKLLESLHGESYGLTAEQRYYLYQTALNTGFRATELASLRPVAFRLAARQPTIRCQATNTKNKKLADQPINPVFARMLAGWIRKHYMPTDKVWPGAWYRRAADMLTADLKIAKIAIETEEGFLDFHALRTTYITNLARAGLHPRAAQKLARHSTIELTMKIYTRLGVNEDAFSISSVNPVSAAAPSRPVDRHAQHPKTA